MAADTLTVRDYRSPASHRVTAALFTSAGLLLAIGGQLHPQGSGNTVDAHLLSMFESPEWPLAHLVLLIGGFTAVLAFISAWRAQTFGPTVQPLLPMICVGWGFGALELIPHLMAPHDAHALAGHEPTPLLDVHIAMQVVASPAVGLTGAVAALAIARAARSWSASALAVFAVVGGLLSAAAGPLVALTDNPQFTVLFPFQAGLAVWLAGTGVRLLRHRGDGQKTGSGQIDVPAGSPPTQG
jgi:hypothetical protein